MPVVIDPQPPHTFDGDSFGRSVAGAVPVNERRRDLGRRAAGPTGLLIDIAANDMVAASPAPPTEFGPDETADGAVEAPPVNVHRRPRVGAPVDTPVLVRSDLEAPTFAAAVARSSRAPVAPTSWSAAEGFRGPAESLGDTRLLHRPADGAERPAHEPAPSTGPDSTDGTADSSSPAVRYLPEPGERSVSERAPASVTEVVHAATGVRVDDVIIDRSPAVSARAAAMGALAYEEGGVVHVPSEIGDASEPVTRAIVAHELTHVAQRRALGASAPPEDSPDGRELEADARRVQRMVWQGAAVGPTFMRDRSSIPEPPASAPTGVRRLPDDPYAWQDRPDGPLFESASDAAGMLLGVRFGRSDREQREVESSRADRHRDFERDHAATLQAERDRHYRELIEDAQRDARLRALREDREVEALSRAEVIAIRTRLDDERPFEFGVPSGIRPYPDELPPEDADSGTADGPSTTVAGRRSDEAPGRRTSNADLPVRHAVGRPDGARRPRVGAGSAGARGRRSSTGPDYGWQERGLSSGDIATGVASMFGGGVLGGIVAALAGDDDDEDDRRQREEARLPDLRRMRHDREIELRHRHLRSVQTHLAREGQPTDPVSLNDSEITQIRTQVDEDMPLEFSLPDYVPRDQDSAISGGAFVATSDLDDERADDETGRADDAGRVAADETPDVDVVDRGTDSGDADAGRTMLMTAPLAAAGDGLAVTADDDAEDADDDDAELIAARVFADATDIDIDVLARRLYGRLRRQLRHELLIDRERAGTLVDVR